MMYLHTYYYLNYFFLVDFSLYFIECEEEDVVRAFKISVNGQSRIRSFERLLRSWGARFALYLDSKCTLSSASLGGVISRGGLFEPCYTYSSHNNKFFNGSLKESRTMGVN